MNSRVAALLAAVLTATACTSSPSETTVVETTPASTAPVASAPTTTSQATTPTTIPPTTTTTPPSLGTDAWLEDLAVLRDQAERIHPDLYWRYSAEQFDQAFADVESQLGGLTDEEIAIEVYGLAAMIDGHSTIPPSAPQLGFHYYAMNVWAFADGVFVTEAEDPAWVGARLLSVGGTPTADALDRLRRFAPSDNEQSELRSATAALLIGELLAHTGSIDDPDRPAFELELIDGSTATVDPARLTPQAYLERFTFRGILPDRPDGAVPIEVGFGFWWTAIEGEQTIYAQYNRVVERTFRRGEDGRIVIDDFVDELRDALDSGPADRVIIDIRFNPGGNNNTYDDLLQFLVEDERLMEPGALRVLTSRVTFSAATNFATELQLLAPHAEFYGEPTGGSPNLFGDVTQITLPNSGLQVFISAVYWEFAGPDDERAALEPDVPVAFNGADWFDGSDPVLEAALQR